MKRTQTVPPNDGTGRRARRAARVAAKRLATKIRRRLDRLAVDGGEDESERDRQIRLARRIAEVEASIGRSADEIAAGLAGFDALAEIEAEWIAAAVVGADAAVRS